MLPVELPAGVQKPPPKFDQREFDGTVTAEGWMWRTPLYHVADKEDAYGVPTRFAHKKLLKLEAVNDPQAEALKQHLAGVALCKWVSGVDLMSVDYAELQTKTEDLITYLTQFPPRLEFASYSQ